MVIKLAGDWCDLSSIKELLENIDHLSHHSELIIDFKDNRWINPWALALVASLGMSFKTLTGNSPKIPYYENEPITYAKRMHLHDILELEEDIPIVKENPSNNRFYELQKISSANDITRSVDALIRCLSIDDAETDRAIRHTFSELLRNVFEHSGSNFGAIVIAQKFLNKGYAQIAIIDDGIGILDSLNKIYPELENDIFAINKSIQPHISGTFHKDFGPRRQDHAGMGLYVMSQILRLCEGEFVLLSGNSALHQYHDTTINEIRYRNYEIPKYHGTFVILNFPLSNIYDYDELMSTIWIDLAKNDKIHLNFILDLKENYSHQYNIANELGPYIQDKVKALELSRNIRQHLDEDVLLDFSNVEDFTHSSAHALIAQLIIDLGYENLHRLKLFDVKPFLQHLLNIIAISVLK